jgi:DNA-binding SARP family transcriptional activator
VLESDPGLSMDGEIQRLRASLVEKDRPVHLTGNDSEYGRNLAEVMLLELLDRNPKNRMAFEYLMAYYMVSKRLDDLCRHLERVKQFGYRETPRLYEEALLARALDKQDGSEPDIPEVSMESRLRAEMFMGAYRRSFYERDLRHLEEFRNSYLYYHFCSYPAPRK